jgi:cytochrome c oxidase cbb3-type subunit 3
MTNFNKIKSLAVTLLIPAVGFCQDEAVKETTSYFTNVLFLTLVGLIIVLAIVIVAFSGVFKNIADSDYLQNKFNSKKDDSNNSSIKNIVSLVLLFSSVSMRAQDAVLAKVIDDGRIGGIDQFTFYFLLFLVFVELFVLGLMFYQFNFLVKTHLTIVKAGKPIKVESKILKSLTDVVPIEEEESILLDHDYDGIKELDNNLPPWWKYGFYLTIVTGVIYLLHFHVFKTGDLQGKEYDNAMVQAKIEVDEFMKTSANNVDENTVKVLTEASDITAGKDLFIANCVACHGKGGEGTVGPNLTDEYWIHGGSIKDLFKTLKYGWVEKGMKSWKDDLSPIQMAQVSSYIRTLKGTNPPNPKAPQGDLYSEAGVAPLNDSTNVKNDSLNINIKPDSVNVGKK